MQVVFTIYIFVHPPQVQDKFRLDLSDEEAVHYMHSLIDESVGALFAAVVEQIHKFAQVCLYSVYPIVESNTFFLARVVLIEFVEKLLKAWVCALNVFVL